jgi:UDP-N-acetylmuramate--alanine ligase
MEEHRARRPWAGRRLHLIGIGGAGMSGLALIAQALGADVSGSDQTASAYLEHLRAGGLDPIVPHAAGNVPDGAEVVVSTAIPDANEELSAARERGLAVLHRGELLAEIAALKRSIVVAGTHGKTSTASMIAHVLIDSGADPGYAIGGELRSTGTNAGWGMGEWAVIEADESDGSFLKLAPEVAVVTNVEMDHHDHWRSIGELRSAFEEFVRPASARVVWAEPARQVPALVAGDAAITYGIEDGDLAAESVRLRGLGSSFTVEGCQVELQIPGRHNVLNALAAMAACRWAGVPLQRAAAALRGFVGAGRRFESHGVTATGARVFDDYAHHPTEVRATLEAARALGARRTVACFQPHLYSRTERLAREFGQALAEADVACVLEVYPAREDAADFPGVSGWMIAARAADASRGRPVYWLPSIDEAARVLDGRLGEGDVLITLGAGDVDRLARRLGHAGDGGDP